MAKRLRSHSEWNAQVLRRFPPGKRYLIGVSGGRDSVALLHWLLDRGYRRLVVCHLNHRLRGRSSTADARLVQRLAASFDLPFVTAAVDVRAAAKKEQRSLETAARVARYEFFGQVARRRRCSTIFLAHHADDLVETFLMNLFRGVGGGLRTIRAESIHRIGKTELTVVRPLGSVWREEIDAYVRDCAFSFREDASNADLEPTRNRMRHRIIPVLEKEFGRTIRKSIWRAASIASEEEAFLETLMPGEFCAAESLSLAELRRLPVALQRRTIRKWLQTHAIADIGFELVQNARALLEVDASSAKINLPGDRHLRRRAGKLFVE